MKLVLFVFFVVAAACVVCQEPYLHTTTFLQYPGSEPREHAVDMIHMKVDVEFDTVKTMVKGKVLHSFRVLQQNVDSLVFDGVKITVLQAMLNGKPARYVVTDTTVVVYCEPSLRWDTEGTVQFTYEATPRRGLFFIGWNDSTGTMRRQIWTQGQAVDNRHWIPMYDEMNDKMLTETIITFDSSYTVISNGIRKSVRSNSNGTKTWHYAMSKPHASYLLMVAIGRYAVATDTTSSGVALEQYYYPDRPQDLEPTYRLSKESMDFLEKETGYPYPWGVYRQVPAADYVYGAMENTTATIFGDFFLTDSRGWLDRSYVTVNVHELTHQWFGDLVTARSLKSLWLQESFATFYPLLFTRTVYGEDEYQWSRRGMQNAALSAGEKDRFPIVHVKAGGSRVYPKGAVVLDMMRTVFGADEQRRVILKYLKQHAFGNVETNDLYLAFQDTLGLSPDWFFNQWLYKGGEPEYHVSYYQSSRDDLKGAESVTTMVVNQVHFTDALTGLFKMPVVCEVHYTDGTKDSVRAWIEEKTTLVDIPNPLGKPIAFLLFDPGSTILKKITFKKSWDMLAAQARKAPAMIDRYDALTQLDSDSTRNMQLLAIIRDVYSSEKHHALRSEAVSMAARLAEKEVAEAWEVVRNGLADKHPDVRKRALAALTIIPEQLRGGVEACLADSSYAVMESALRRLCRSFPARADSYISIVQGVRSPGAAVEIAVAEYQASQGNTEAAAVLAEFCGPKYDFVTRRNAFQAVVRLGTATSAMISNIADALRHQNWRLTESARDTLAKLTGISQNRDLIWAESSNVRLTKAQQKILQDLAR